MSAVLEIDARRTLGAVAAVAIRRLKDAGVASPRLDARLLLDACLPEDAGPASADLLAAHRHGRVDDVTRARFEAMVARRIAGEPVSRILGKREFWSLEFTLSPATLDPRPDSETVVEAALARIGDRQQPLRILDLGTGSGCLLLALLSELPEARGVGVDIEAKAARAAAANAERLGLAGRAAFVADDWGAGLAPGFDCVLSNPPYIPSRDIEGLPAEVRCDPVASLDGGADGLDGIRGATRAAARLLEPGGLALIEIGAGQAQAAADVASQAGLDFLEIDKDLAGHPRVLVARAGDRQKSAFTIR